MSRFQQRLKKTHYRVNGKGIFVEVLIPLVEREGMPSHLVATQQVHNMAPWSLWRDNNDRGYDHGAHG